MRSIPPSVRAVPGNFTCFVSTEDSGQQVGDLPPTYCIQNISTCDPPYQQDWFQNQKKQLADVWWMCGDMKLRTKLPPKWKGSCALTHLLLPFYIIPVGDEIKLPQLKKQHFRMKGNAPQGSFDNRVYIDSIGVPRGVPNEFKAQDQISAGFTSIFLWIQPNKNVDWINYIYYNQQRFVNYTRDALKGVASQLDATSLTAWQNRIALDMLLAEKGGVCKMFGTFCCTFIPNNTAPDGSITKALQGLQMLSEELAENSGVENPLAGLFETWFGKWGELVGNMLISIVMASTVLTLCGCCCIPCVRGLLQRFIDTSLTKTMFLQKI